MAREARIHRTRLAWRASTPRTFLSVRLMGGRRIVRRVASSRRIGHIIVGRWVGVFGKWIITVLGESPPCW